MIRNAAAALALLALAACGGDGGRGHTSIVAAGDIASCFWRGDEATARLLDDIGGLVSRHTRFSKLEVLPECGHVVNVDRPELFNLLSMDFIRSATPSPA